jgi:hypothetical protein
VIEKFYNIEFMEEEVAAGEKRKQNPDLTAEGCLEQRSCTLRVIGRIKDFNHIHTRDLFIMILQSSLPTPMGFLPLTQK